MVRCKNCGAELSEGARFCIQCGTAVTNTESMKIVCKHCGKSWEAGRLFCPDCGYRLTDQIIDPIDEAQVNIELTDVGSKKVRVIKVVRETLGISLQETVSLVNNAPIIVKRNAAKADAESLMWRLTNAGAKVRMIDDMQSERKICRLTMVRPKKLFGCAMVFNIIVDNGEAIYDLKNGQEIHMDLAQGTHYIEASMTGVNQKKKIALDLQGNKKITCRINPDTTTRNGQATALVILEDETGRRL